MTSLLIANRGEIARRIIRTASAWACARSRSIPMRIATPCMCARRMRRCGSAPASPRESYLEHRGDHRGGAAGRRRRRASGLRLPRRERGLRASRDRCGPDLGRAAARGDPPDGRQGGGEAHRARRRRADHSGLRRGRPERRRAHRGGERDRLSGDDQGRGRRRRARHAARRATRRVGRRAEGRALGGRACVRRRTAAAGTRARTARAISRCRCSPTSTAMSCISASATARCSGGTRS